jgi:hypothetical protein
MFGAIAAHEGGDAPGGHGLEFVVAIGVGSGLQGESVERRGDHEPGQLLGGEVGVVDAQGCAPRRGRALITHGEGV